VLRRIDANTFHGGEVNDHAAVDKRSSRNIVATAADSHKHTMHAGKVDSVDDVGNSGTLNDQCRVFVDERVVVPSGHIVVRITRTQYPATHTTFEFLDEHVVQVYRFDQLHDRGSFPALAGPFACATVYKDGCISATVTQAPIRETTQDRFHPANWFADPP
jgi:hypothetical protein